MPNGRTDQFVISKQELLGLLGDYSTRANDRIDGTKISAHQVGVRENEILRPEEVNRLLT